MARVRARACYDADGGVAVRFPFDAEVVEFIKAVAPSGEREWRPESKEWWVAPRYARQIVAHLYDRWPDVEIVQPNTGHRHRATPPHDASLSAHVPDPYAALHLLPTAPPELCEAAYRVLAKLCHPDRLPEPFRAQATRPMCRLNAAIAALRERWEAQ